ncbi:Drug resistance transporter EmrB/QacA subfamily [Bradyrhizobium sp. STM 3843]|uniref:DHA2 family efflux MFS transporter permease subunit n=1 Tax=Bradyrhizobium sp. STM 3843 TaxID=551947 RepID=UPI000240AAC1|nr:DHA2 family efflux MFS transporter permease subunit [Bradyrhizobium sp. STM 3843]CCE05536.1 Drug resistance transporter EmrB/QacA subfamily [Bradyrhizobium sp. STM 3843]
MSAASDTVPLRTGAAGSTPAGDTASAVDWIAVVAGALGALMATLDTSITNTALPQIQGEVGASGTEGTWIGTGYLVAEVVMIPLTAWLTRLLGLRRLLLITTIAFVLFSMLCGVSDGLLQMIIGRAGQGFFGGALIPTAQVIIRTRLPPRQMAVGMSIFGVIVLLGPVIGPVIGGYLAEEASWRWCFFLNLPVGIALVTLLVLGLPEEKAELDLLAKADWLGIAGMAVAFACLTVVLEEGQRERWFESSVIVDLCLVSLLGFVAMAVAQTTSPDPVIKLALLRNGAFASATFITLVVGAAVYGTTFVVPQFLSSIAGYNPRQAGGIMALAAIPVFVLIPVLPRIIGRFDTRLMVALGLLCFAASCFVDIHLSPDSAGGDFTLSQLMRGVGQILAAMPLNQASMAAIGRENAADGAGIYSMARNLGGSIGLALCGVFIDHRSAVHSDTIREAVTANSLMGQARLAADGLSQGIDQATARLRAIAQLSSLIEKQALVMTYSDCFWLLGILLLAIIPIVLLLRSPKPGAAMAAGH